MFDFQDPWGDSTVEPVQLNYPSRACLDDVVLPPMYDKAYIAASGNDGSVMREDLVKLLNKAELSVLTLEEILILAVPERSGPVSRQSFNLALALISLAQRGIEPSLISLEANKRSLTEPVFYDFDEEEFRTQQPDADKPSLIGNEESSINDSWGGKEGKGARSRESFSKKSVDNRDRKFSTGTVKTEESESRRSVEENLSEILSKLKLVDGDDLSQFALEEDPIDVVESAERGGVVFKHINYDITTKETQAKVVRRYNDFFYLSTYLGKKYFFRMLPLIPPKGFPDNRLEGLNRFANAIYRIPYLKNDAVVKMFFTDKADLNRELKNYSYDTKVEELDLNVLASGISYKQFELFFADLDKVYASVLKDLDSLRVQAVALERVSRYTSLIGDEILTLSEGLRPSNVPHEESEMVSLTLQPRAADKKLNRCLGELSLSLSDISLLDKSMSQMINSGAISLARRLIRAMFTMKALIDRLKTYDRSSEAKKVEERLIGYKQQLHALTEANSSDSSQINKVTKLLNAEKSSIFEIQYEERLMKIMFFHEHERYRRYKAFYYKIYNRLVGDFVKHHTLMLNAWKQSATPASFIPSDPEDFS